MKSLKLMTLCLLCFLQLSFATTYRELSLEEMLTKAELVFYAVVIAVDPLERDDGLWTQVSFELIEGFKGLEEDAAAAELLFYGGVPLDGSAVQVSLMPQFNVGETVLVFAYEGDFYSPIVGFRQGLWREQAEAFIDELGNRLSLGEEGQLLRQGVGASPEDLLDALRLAIEAQE